MCAWKTNYDINGNRNVYNDDNELIGTEYSQMHDSRLKDSGSSESSGGTGTRRGGSTSGGGLIADLIVPVIGFTLRYAPFVALAWFLASRIIPEYYPWKQTPAIVWGLGASGGIMAALLVRWLFRLVFSGSSVLLIPFKIVLFVLICGLQFVVFGGFTYSVVSGTNALPTSPEELTTRGIIGLAVGVVVGVLVALWVWRRWSRSVFGE